MIPAATYLAMIENYGLSQTNSGSPQYAVQFKIVEDGEAKGQTLTWYGSLGASEAALDITMKALATMGMKGDDIADENLLDKTVPYRVVVVHDSYQGRVSAKIRFVNSASGPAFKKPSDPSKIAASLKGSILAAQKRLAAKGDVPKEEDENASKDDLPF